MAHLFGRVCNFSFNLYNQLYLLQYMPRKINGTYHSYSFPIKSYRIKKKKKSLNLSNV